MFSFKNQILFLIKFSQKTCFIYLCIYSSFATMAFEFEIENTASFTYRVFTIRFISRQFSIVAYPIMEENNRLNLFYILVIYICICMNTRTRRLNKRQVNQCAFPCFLIDLFESIFNAL